MKITADLNKLNADDVKIAFVELIEDYLTPAFGSMSKRDFDILLFMKLQGMGVIDQNPEIYELVTDLRVTRAKARNLLYEAKLRSSTKEDLDLELKELIQKPMFLKDKDKTIGMEIENPYLIDHLRYKLKKLNHITDGSFSPELVKLTSRAYLDLFKEFLPDDSEKKIVNAFVKLGVEGDKSFSGIMTAVLTKLGTKVADKAGGEAAESLVKYLGPVISGSVKNIKEIFTPLFSDSEENI